MASSEAEKAAEERYPTDEYPKWEPIAELREGFVEGWAAAVERAAQIAHEMARPSVAEAIREELT